MFKSSNPALNSNTFKMQASMDSTKIMTMSGTVNKAFILLFLLVISANWTWSRIGEAQSLLMLGLIGGFILATVTVFKKDWAGFTAPVYALMEGLALGGISSIFQAKYPGIAFQAIFLTFATLLSLLIVYRLGFIKATENFKLGVFAATGGIALFYLASLVLGFFKINIPYVFASGPIGIGFSFFVVVIASLNLVLDFDFIEQGCRAGAPKYMEWYAAFGLMITLVWLYIEILNLLAKTRKR